MPLATAAPTPVRTRPPRSSARAEITWDGITAPGSAMAASMVMTALAMARAATTMTAHALRSPAMARAGCANAGW